MSDSGLCPLFHCAARPPGNRSTWQTPVGLWRHFMAFLSDMNGRQVEKDSPRDAPPPAASNHLTPGFSCLPLPYSSKIPVYLSVSPDGGLRHLQGPGHSVFKITKPFLYWPLWMFMCNSCCSLKPLSTLLLAEVSISVINTMTECNLEGKNLFHLIFLHHSPSLKEIRAGSKAGTMEKNHPSHLPEICGDLFCFWLSYISLFLWTYPFVIFGGG